MEFEKDWIVFQNWVTYIFIELFVGKIKMKGLLKVPYSPF